MFPGTKTLVFRLYRMSLLSFAPGTSLNSSQKSKVKSQKRAKGALGIGEWLLILVPHSLISLISPCPPCSPAPCLFVHSYIKPNLITFCSAFSNVMPCLMQIYNNTIAAERIELSQCIKIGLGNSVMV